MISYNSGVILRDIIISLKVSQNIIYLKSMEATLFGSVIIFVEISLLCWNFLASAEHWSSIASKAMEIATTCWIFLTIKQCLSFLNAITKLVLVFFICTFELLCFVDGVGWSKAEVELFNAFLFVFLEKLNFLIFWMNLYFVILFY